MCIGPAFLPACVLALLFFFSLLPKTVSLGLKVSLTAISALIIVLIVTGIISKKYIITQIRMVEQSLQKTLKRKLLSTIFDDQQWNYYKTQLSYLFSWIHYIYFHVEDVQTFVTQLVFSVAGERLFCPLQRFSSLYVLLFYNFLAYVQRSLKKRPWAQLFHLWSFNESSTTEFIKLTTAFIIVRLGKGIAVTLVLLTFSYQFKNIELTYTFVSTTFFYFCITQYQNNNFVKNYLVDCLTKLQLQCLDGLEEYWIPVFIYLLTTGMSFIVFMGLFIYSNCYFTMLTLIYINFFIPIKYSLQPAWELLCDQKAIISKYPLVTWNNDKILEKYPCAVCLDKMRVFSARSTPCGHVFHGSCLRKCLHYSNHCPLCKSIL